MARNCFLEITLNTWRDQLLQILGTEFGISNCNSHEVLTKRCQIQLWENTQVGTIEVAFFKFVSEIPVPILITHNETDKRQLEARLDSPWLVMTKKESKYSNKNHNQSMKLSRKLSTSCT